MVVVMESSGIDGDGGSSGNGLGGSDGSVHDASRCGVCVGSGAETESSPDKLWGWARHLPTLCSTKPVSMDTYRWVRRMQQWLPMCSRIASDQGLRIVLDSI